ncbi:uncharacterized protein FOMMEDRAFT_118278 [Fomitiporia mediterranea MF3/22]|uniref:uncharacterized protein n=1 Tax=Fomitiporia mediterranea (strain MF3/22) TaxID=694068 RepID=UPI00044095C5|nr:uncharacterized protein FOMMEDRAFT_118278 [Fomitiporia mediterranea MF3/22]EJD07164.1 hypothetical protein FOMMEDRAFT_118278 [Fomitiporia mediterranea MF3/22]
MSSRAEEKRRMSDDDVQEPVDHRKRRRNRTTQSCLNCHGSKRMCDRKRPACGRCVKLGLSGTCVYEVDDINRRDPSQNEVTLLKNRIAELEGFIREYKRKPHPRLSTNAKKRFGSSIPSGLGFDNGAESDSSSDSKDARSLRPIRVTSYAESSSESDNLPCTPSVQGDEPVFLTAQTSDVPPQSTSGSSISQSGDLDFSPDILKSMANSAMDIDVIFDFASNGFGPGEGDALERVFARIMEQDSQNASHVSQCQCREQPSARSILRELTPHLRRALDSMRSSPEHQAESPEFGSSCSLFGQLQHIHEMISSIVETPLEIQPLAQMADSPQVIHSSESAIRPPQVSGEDSPLQRVLAARRAGLVPQPVFDRLSAPTTTVGVQSKSWRGSTVQTSWEASEASSSSGQASTDNDQLMSWEPWPRGEWPRTITL